MAAAAQIQAQPLLICFTDDANAAVSFDHQATRVFFNMMRLRRFWEDRERPIAYVAPATRTRLRDNAPASKIRLLPRAGDLVFEQTQPSAFRDWRFRSFYADAGCPPIVIMGTGLDRRIAATVFDECAAGFSITVVADAVFAADSADSSKKRTDILNVMARGAHITELNEVLEIDFTHRTLKADPTRHTVNFQPIRFIER